MTQADLKALPHRARWRAIEAALQSERYDEAVYFLSYSHGSRTLRRLLELASTPGPPQHLAIRGVGDRMGMAGYSFFRDLFGRADLSDEMREVAADVCCGGSEPWNEEHVDYEKAIDLVAAQLHHSSPEVRFSACFSLGRTRSLRMLPSLEPLLMDDQWSWFGKVSKMADVASRRIQGEAIDLYSAFEKRPEDLDGWTPKAR